MGFLLSLSIGVLSEVHAESTPEVLYNGGMRFDSQWGGTPNTLSAYGFAPFFQGEAGDVFYADGFLNLDLASMYSSTNVGGSTRLGYRYLTPDKNWILGANSGVDISPYQATAFYQAGMGLEALSREVEFRVNGYLPFGTTNYYASSGYYNAYLSSNRLFVNGYNTYGVALSSVEAEAGTSVFNWEGGNIKTYGAYYHLSGDYTNSTSGFRGRVESDLGDYVAIGSTVSYDDIYKTWGTGYIRIGLEPQAKPKGEELNFANSNFLAQRGMPVERTRNVRINMSQNNVGTQVAVGSNGNQLNVVCNSNAANSGCANTTSTLSKADFSAAVGTPNTVVLLGNGTQVNLGGDPVVASGVTISNGANAPTVQTQFGAVNLARVFNAGTGANPIIGQDVDSSGNVLRTSAQGGFLNLGSNTTVSGLTFQNTSLISSGTQNINISNNNFTGSYTTANVSIDPTMANGNQTFAANIQTNPNAGYATIALTNVTGVNISGNNITAPNVIMYQSNYGTLDAGGSEQICARHGDSAGVASNGYCLAANAINLTNSGGVTVTKNTISYAIDEGIKINNPTGTTTVSYNTITKMGMGPDTNQQAAIFTRLNTGTATVNVIGNDISQNRPGQFSVNSSTGELTFNGTSGVNYKNIIDPIEVGVCRGTQTYPRADDAYSDSGWLTSDTSPTGTINPNGIGNCGSTATLNYFAINNVIHAVGDDANADGIDLNTGYNSVLNATIEGNSITGLKFRNAGITGDLRGNSVFNATISSNTISDPSPIGIELGYGPMSGSPNNQTSGTVTISKNNIIGTTFDAIDIEIAGASTPTQNFNLAFNVTGNIINAEGSGPSGGIGISTVALNTQTVFINGGSLTASVTGNTIDLGATSTGNAFKYESKQGTYTSTVALKNNNMTVGASASNAIIFSLPVNGTDAANVTATIQGNTLASTSTNAQIIDLSNTQSSGYLGVYNLGSLTTINSGFSTVNQMGVTSLP